MSTRFDATPISTFARAPRPQLAPPLGKVGRRGLVREVLRERGDREPVLVLHRVRARHDGAEPRLRKEMVAAVHEQHPAAGETRRAELCLVAARPVHEPGGIAREVAPVRVRAVEVLGAHS